MTLAERLAEAGLPTDGDADFCADAAVRERELVPQRCDLFAQPLVVVERRPESYAERFIACALALREPCRRLLPAALPQIVTGLRTGLSLAWMFMVAAELIAATRGLGFLLSDGRETGRPDLVFGAILLLALLGKLTDGAMARIESHWLGWRDAYDHTPRKGSA